MQPPTDPLRPPPEKDSSTAIVLIVVAVAAAGLIIVVLALALLGAGAFFVTRAAKPPPTKSPAATTATAGPAGCGDCAWPGTGCASGVCQLLPTQQWAVRPRMVTLTDVPASMDRQPAKVCLRPIGGTFVCTSSVPLPVENGAHKRYLGFSKSTGGSAEIVLRTPQLSSGGFDASVSFGSTQLLATGLHHASGVRPSQLLFSGGLRFSGQGSFEAIVVDLEAL